MRRAVGAGVWAVSWVLALASVALAMIWQLPTEPLPGMFLSPAPADMKARFDDIGVTVALIYGPVAAVILARRPHPVGVIVAVHAVGSGISAFGVQYGLLGAQIAGLPLWDLAVFAAGWGFVPGTFMTAVLALLVTRRRLPAWQRASVILCLLCATGAFVLSLTQQSVASPRNPLAIGIPAAVSVHTYTVLSFIAVGLSFVTCGVLVVRWMRSRGRARTGIAWLTLGHAFLTLSYLVLVLPAGLALPAWIVGFGVIAPVLGQVLYPAAILVAVLGQRLWGVEVVVSRILLWSLLSLTGVALYLLVVTVVPAALGGGAAFLGPLVVALAVLPVRDWLQQRIDRLIYGEGADAAQLVARLGVRVGELPPGPEGLTELAGTLRRVLRLGRVEIRSFSSSLEAAAGTATRTTAATRVPLGSPPVGELWAQPVAGQRLDRRTRTVLGDVAGLVATVVQLIESYLVLDAARRELVARRADERRAIRRELHDGLGPALAGIGFGLAAAERLAARDPAKARALLADLQAEAGLRAREVRELAAEVSAPQLEGVALPGALRRLGRRFASERRSVHVDIGPTRELRADVADALYAIAAEALTNAARHSAARAVTIRVRIGPAETVLEVRDDGRGIPAGLRPGVGVASMRERAAALGGAVELAPAPGGGTLVRARVPTGKPDAPGIPALASGTPGRARWGQAEGGS